MIDNDLLPLSLEALQAEVMKLREAIRHHRDQKGDENCWLDDGSYLYGLLPEKIKADPHLPPKQLMMVNCSRYYDCRKGGKLYAPLDELPKKMEFAIEWIDIKERVPPFDIVVVVMNMISYNTCVAYNETYNEAVMTGIAADGRLIKIPFEVTHWFPLPD